MPRQYTPMAIVYDFDGTLAPGNMQERQFIPDVGMTASEFWDEVDRLAQDHQADKILMYMHLMLKKAAENGVSVHLENFRERGKQVVFLQGVEDWFDRINSHSRNKGVRTSHYIVSSGNAEIIEGTDISSKLTRIYASKFMFNHNDVAEWPAQAVNFTTKTQYLFRINKGAEDLSDDTKINKYVKMEDRPVPFENMIYIGDGETDVPCFRLVKDLGGLAIAVYKPYTQNMRNRAEQFLDDERVHSVVPADYSEGKKLDKLVKSYIDLVAARQVFSKRL